MKIIFAQGNPESRFEHTRHNIGFAVIDAFAAAHDATWVIKSKFKARIAEVTIGDEKVLLIKPTTYYNETGVSARALIDFYHLESHDILVLHDDLALPFGTIRTRAQGSDAGNNGIKSLNSHIGPSYNRIRIGIWNDLRDRTDDADFVLGNFSTQENDLIKSNLTPHVINLIHEFISTKLKPSTHNP